MNQSLAGTEYDIDPTFENRLAVIRWDEFATAYGPATDVPDQLKRLADADPNTARRASHELWCGLCHQHVQVANAAVPAMPFLLEVLDATDSELAAEILDILLGFALCTHRARTIEFRQAMDWEIFPEQPWVTELRRALLDELPRFERMRDDRDEDVANFAARTVAALHAPGHVL